MGAAAFLSRVLGTAPDPVPSIYGTNNDQTPEEIDAILGDLQSDIHRMNLLTLGEDISPERIKQYRNRARYGDPRYLYAMMDEMIRLGPGAQMRTATEAMKSARPQFLTNPEDWNDDTNKPEDADPTEVAEARAARDFLEDTLSPKLDELIGIHANSHWYGIADSKLILNPRGNANRWDSIDEIEEIPARRHRLDVNTHEWMLMLSPDSWDGYPVKDLLLQPDRGNEGLFFTEIGKGSTSLDQRGILMQCFPAWNALQYTLRWRLKGLELNGVPFRWAEVDFAHPNRVAEAKRGMSNMGSTGFALVQTGTKLNFAPEMRGGGDPFADAIDWSTRQFDEKFLGHSQMTGVQKGVGGKMQGQQAVQQFEDLTNSRLRTLSPDFERLGKTLVTRNLGQHIADQHAPIIKLRFEDRDDPEIVAKVALTLFQANAGELVGVDDLVRRCLGHVADDGDKNLGPAPKNALGSAPGAAPGNASAPMSALESKQALQAIGNADSAEYPAIRRVIQRYQESEKRRALAFAKRRRGRG